MASAFGAGLLGPFSLVVWVIAGIIAIVIALCFAQCAALLPKVGGPYAYAHAAWEPFAGFIVGWSLWLAEWMSPAVFPVAFTQYHMIQQLHTEIDVADTELLYAPIWFAQSDHKGKKVVLVIDGNSRGVINGIGL